MEVVDCASALVISGIVDPGCVLEQELPPEPEDKTLGGRIPKRAKVEKLVVVQVTVLFVVSTIHPVSRFQFVPSYLCILRVDGDMVAGMSASVYVIVIVMGLSNVVTEVPTPLNALRS